MSLHAHNCPPSIEAAELIGPTLAPTEPEFRLIGIAALTGAATSGETSTGLGNDTDFALLNALRLWSDAVLVGGETARTENYFGVRITAQERAERASAGRFEVPPIVVRSCSLDFDTSTQLFTDTQTPPLFAVPQEALQRDDVRRRAAAIEFAGGEIVPVQGSSVQAVCDALRGRGLHRIVCEGGPTLSSMCMAEDVVDVFHYSISPLAVQPSGVRLFAEVEEDCAHRYVLEDARATADSLLFCRYRRVRGS